MTPSFTDFFKSFYYSKTFLPPVDLSFKGTRKHLLETAGGNEMANVMAIAKEIIDPIVQSIFSEPLTYDPKSVKVKNESLKSKGFELLSRKSGQEHYSVVEHSKLKGWVIKAGATRTPKGQFDMCASNDRHEMTNYSEEGNLLRIAMAERVRAVAKASGIDVVVSMKKLFEYEQPNGTKITNRYCIFSKKIDILSEKETLERVKNMDEAEQRKLAQELSTIIQKAGLVDNGFHNIRLSPDGKLAFIDTEPGGQVLNNVEESDYFTYCKERRPKTDRMLFQLNTKQPRLD